MYIEKAGGNGSRVLKFIFQETPKNDRLFINYFLYISMPSKTINRPSYTPLYFLASLGAGGIAVAFFMFLMSLIPHEGTPIPTFDHIFPVLLNGTLFSFFVGIALIGILIFGFFFIKLLIWNFKEYFAFKKTEAFSALKSGNDEVTLMAIPLTLAMGMNVGFILGAVFIPGLWSIVEYLFPAAILGFLAIGIFAIKIFLEYFTRLLTKAEFDFSKNNSLAQMIAIFAFSMIAVGFAAPGAMSHHIETNAIGIFGSIFFGAFAGFLLLINLTLGFKSMFKHGINKEASPSLWIMIPILTLLGITAVRVTYGLHHGFETELIDSSLFTLTSLIVSFQAVFALLGWAVMKNNKYFETFIHSDKKSVGSFALICPGVATVVFGWFFLIQGLVLNGVIPEPHDSPIIFGIFLLPILYIQAITIKYFFILKNKFGL